MIERAPSAPRVSDADPDNASEVIIAVGKLVYEFLAQSAERVAFDPTTLWCVLDEGSG
jgi:hypothetical protein